MTLDSGTNLGPYEIVAPIGAGGMGEVYKAIHALNGLFNHQTRGETSRCFARKTSRYEIGRHCCLIELQP